MKNTDIAIVGMSCFVPDAQNIKDFWNNLVHGRDSITEAPHERIDPMYFSSKDTNSTDKFYCNKGGFISKITFDPTRFGLDTKTIENLDPVHLLALRLVYQALEDANVFKHGTSLEKGSIIIGKGNYPDRSTLRNLDITHESEQIAEVLKAALPNTSAEDIEKIKESFQQEKKKQYSHYTKDSISHQIASDISSRLGIHGAAYTVDADSASSLLALDHAIKELLTNSSDIAIAGGIHTELNAHTWSLYSQARYLSHSKQIRPFSKDADGLLLGEGAGFVVLKRLETAIADGDRIYSVIKGVGISNNVSEKGQILAVEQALSKAKVSPKDITYLEANGISTTDGDQSEIENLNLVFGTDEKKLGKIAIGSLKSNIGHTLSASGILSLIKTSLALYFRQIPPTLHCDTPIEEISKSRFYPITKLTDWNETTKPAMAGVSTFGIDGGPNVHVVMGAYGEKALSFGTNRNVLPKSPEEVIVISASSKEKLLEALDKKDFNTSAKGNYRLVLFNPTDERIEKAKRLIDRDKPWKGRQDIWFSNESLLGDGGKIAFLFAGFDPSAEPEMVSVTRLLDTTLPQSDISVKSNPLLAHAFKMYHTSSILDKALKTLGVEPDMYAGHSLGEWFAANSAGLMANGSVEKLLETMNPDDFYVADMYFIATGCGLNELKDLLEIIPELYLSNDNCPNQVLLCGRRKSIDTLIIELKKRQIYYQILDFQSGFHTPFIEDKLHMIDESMAHLKIQTPTYPIWSATTLGLYPSTPDEFKHLTIKHVTEPVRFRELIDKLYNEEKARVFIQIGSGSLVGFVDDILKNKNYSVASTCIESRITIEQIRRIIALLFIEGKDMDKQMVIGDSSENKLFDEIVKHQIPTPIIKEFPLIKEALERENRSSSSNIESLVVESNNPIVQALHENIKEMILMQKDMVELFEQKGLLNNKSFASRNTFQAKSTVKEQVIQTQVISEPITKVAKVENQFTPFEEDLNISLETHPYIIGHSLVRQPDNWPYVKDTNPVIPMTMTFELLAEAAHRQAPSKKILKIGPISVFQWMGVDKPFIQKITGLWKTEDTISVSIKNFAQGDITLGDTYPTPPKEYTGTIDLGENIKTPPNRETIYDLHMFHGPSYQGIEKITHITKKGLRGYIRKSDGKGSLLDNIGQLFGLYLQMILDKDHVSFPVKVQDIQFYQDMYDQEGIFECVCLLDNLGDEFGTGTIVINRDGKTWCIIQGWLNRRFEFDDKLWNVTMAPTTNHLGIEIEPGIFFFDNAYKKSPSWDFISRRYLNEPEKNRYNEIFLNKRKDYIISRVVLKDAIRKYVANNYHELTHPIRYYLEYDEKGKPYAHDILDKSRVIEMSLAHKTTNAVAIASNKPVGIDLETIEERTDGFMKLSFTEKELNLLKDKDKSEWSTRFWVAKEAYSKMIGTGLEGKPKQYEVEAIDGEILTVRGTKIKTIKYNNTFIIGWTI